MADLTDAEWLRAFADDFDITAGEWINRTSVATQAERLRSIAARLERPAVGLTVTGELRHYAQSGKCQVQVFFDAAEMPGCCEGMPVKVTITPAGEDGG